VQVQYLSFDEQISSFEIVKKAMIAKIGKEAAEAAVNAALFQIGLGEGESLHLTYSILNPCGGCTPSELVAAEH